MTEQPLRLAQCDIYTHYDPGVREERCKNPVVPGMTMCSKHLESRFRRKPQLRVVQSRP